MRRGGGYPRGLRGKEIGLYYARKNTEGHKPVYESLKLREEIKSDIISWRRRFGERDRVTTSVRGGRNAFMSRYEENLKKNREVYDDLVWSDDEVVDSKEEEEVVKEEEEEEKEKEKEEDGRNREGIYKCRRRRPMSPSKYNCEPSANPLSEFRKKLPAWQKKDEINEALVRSRILVISGETGCGKTTQVPQFILDHAIDQGKGEECNIICTQPRRISAISVAERVAVERGESRSGKSVGYQVRLESKLPRSGGSILYCTTGVPLQWMRSNSSLSGISHVILDEIHERDVLSDFFITILKDLMKKREDLKVLLMSATLNARQFSRYFDDCPVIEIPGQTFPVQEYYLEDVLEITRYPIDMEASTSSRRRQPYASKARRETEQQAKHNEFIQPYLRALSDRYSRRTIESLSSYLSEEFDPVLVAELVKHIHNKEPDGAILVFFSGWDEISKVHDLLNDDRGQFNRLRVYPLHSLMPTLNQREIFEKPPRGYRKVVLATNIAETSITIEDVRYVIDCGKIKLTDFDTKAGVETLKPGWISLANARQRRGRAGRVQEGICYRLYTSVRESTFESYVKPEILRARLEGVILNIKILELGKAALFLGKMMESPDSESIQHALSLLKCINALDQSEQLTPLGFHLAELPMDPRIGKMILLGAIFSCLDPILSIAASLSFKTPFIVPLGKEELASERKYDLSENSSSDHITFSNALNSWENSSNKRDFSWHYFLSSSTLGMLEKLKRQFADFLYEKKFISSKDPGYRDCNINSNNLDVVRAVITAGLYPSVARVKKQRGKQVILKTSKIERVSFHGRSVLADETCFDSKWIVYYLMLQGESSTFIIDGSVVNPLALVLFGKNDRLTQDGTLQVDDFVKFSCSESDAEDLKDLRRAFNRLMENRINNPKSLNWNNLSNDEAMLMNILINIVSDRLDEHDHPRYM